MFIYNFWNIIFYHPVYYTYYRQHAKILNIELYFIVLYSEMYITLNEYFTNRLENSKYILYRMFRCKHFKNVHIPNCDIKFSGMIITNYNVNYL